MKSVLFLILAATTILPSQAQTKTSSQLSKNVRATIKNHVEVQSQARAVFRRAASLYGGVKTWRITWREWGIDGQRGQYNPQEKSIVFDRAGRIRVENPNGIIASIVMDGKTHWELITTGHTFFHNPIVYTREPQQKYPFDVAHELSWGNSGENLFEDLLENDNPLSTEKVKTLTQKAALRGFDAKILLPQSFQGETCDVVRVINRTQDVSAKPRSQIIEQRTFWFARSDGRLMRWQAQHMERGQVVTSSDAQVQTQEFNPVLNSQEFRFVPPKGAVRYKE